MEAGLLPLHAAGHIGGLVAALGLLRVLAFAAVHQSLLGLHLGCAFAPHHKGLAMADDLPRDFLRRQGLTSRNVRGTAVTHWLLAGLDLRIEHHLFPGMPRPRLEHARPLVRAHGRAPGLPRTEAGLLESLPRGPGPQGGARLPRR